MTDIICIIIEFSKIKNYNIIKLEFIMHNNRLYNILRTKMLNYCCVAILYQYLPCKKIYWNTNRYYLLLP